MNTPCHLSRTIQRQLDDLACAQQRTINSLIGQRDALQQHYRQLDTMEDVVRMHTTTVRRFIMDTYGPVAHMHGFANRLMQGSDDALRSVRNSIDDERKNLAQDMQRVNDEIEKRAAQYNARVRQLRTQSTLQPQHEAADTDTH